MDKRLNSIVYHLYIITAFVNFMSGLKYKTYKNISFWQFQIFNYFFSIQELAVIVLIFFIFPYFQLIPYLCQYMWQWTPVISPYNSDWGIDPEGCPGFFTSEVPRNRRNTHTHTTIKKISDSLLSKRVWSERFYNFRSCRKGGEIHHEKTKEPQSAEWLVCCRKG